MNKVKPRECVLKPNTFTLLQLGCSTLGEKLNKMTPTLRFLGLGKYRGFFFVLFLFCLFFKDTAMNSAGKLAGSQTAVLA